MQYGFTCNNKSVKSAIQIFMLVGILVLLSACTTMKPVLSDDFVRFDNIIRSVQIGDSLVISKKNGEIKQISSVNKIDRDSISGDGEKIPISDIRVISKKEYDMRKTIQAGAWGSLLFFMLAFP